MGVVNPIDLPRPPDPGPMPEVPGKQPPYLTREWQRWTKVSAVYEAWLRRNRAFVLWHCRYLLMDESLPAVDVLTAARRALVVLTTTEIERSAGGDR